MLQRRGSLRAHSPLSLSSASVTPPEWESTATLEESIAKLGEEKKKEEERRKQEAKKEEDRIKEEERKRVEENAKKDQTKKTPKSEEVTKRVVFQKSASPPTPSSSTTPSKSSSTEAMNVAPSSPSRSRLASSAMNVKVSIPLYGLFFFSISIV